MPELPLTYINGEMRSAEQAALPLADMGLHGVAATEMTRTFRHRCFRLEEHLDRLESSLDALSIDGPLSRDEWRNITEQVLAHNTSLIRPDEDLMVNHLVTAGGHPAYGSVDDRPTVCVQTIPLQFSRWAARYSVGQHLIVPNVRAIPPQCIDPRIKSRNRLHWYLADRQARQVDETAVALLLDCDGHLTETSSGNFFIVRQGRLITPRLTKTLNGVSQQVVIEFAAELRIPFEERDITLDGAMSADEAFCSSTSYCLLPVTRLNSAMIGDGQPGRIYRRLLDAWNASVGVDIVAQATA